MDVYIMLLCLFLLGVLMVVVVLMNKKKNKGEFDDVLFIGMGLIVCTVLLAALSYGMSI